MYIAIALLAMIVYAVMWRSMSLSYHTSLQWPQKKFLQVFLGVLYLHMIHAYTKIACDTREKILRFTIKISLIPGDV